MTTLSIIVSTLQFKILSQPTKGIFSKGYYQGLHCSVVPYEGRKIATILDVICGGFIPIDAMYICKFYASTQADRIIQ